MEIAYDVTDLIGNTPLVRLYNLTKGMKMEVVVKLGSFHPAHIVKDHIGLSMRNAPEKAGMINSDTIILVPTSGNTGIALVMLCAAGGYKYVLTMPDTFSKERCMFSGAYGTELVLTRGSDGMSGAIRKVEEITAADRRNFILQQFKKPPTPRFTFAPQRKKSDEYGWHS